VEFRFGKNPIANSTNALAQPLTLDLIQKSLLYPLWVNNKADPEELWVNALESIRITDLVLGASGTPYRVTALGGGHGLFASLASLRRLPVDLTAVVTIADDQYPAVLRERLGTWAPPVLFGSGPASLLVAGGIAIVGSRDADDDAVAFTARLSSAAVAGGSSVVSGGARGIDVTAMRAAFEAGGSVVGVVPEGVERGLRDPSTRSAVAGGQAVLVSPYHPIGGVQRWGSDGP